MARSLRIRRVFLLASEEGRVRDLPAPACALGLDEEDAERLKAGLPILPATVPPPAPAAPQ